MFRRYRDLLCSVKIPDFLFPRLSYHPSLGTHVPLHAPVSYSRMLDEVKKAFKDLGISPARVGLHSFRRGGTTAAANADVNDRLIQKQIVGASLRTAHAAGGTISRRAGQARSSIQTIYHFLLCLVPRVLEVLGVDLVEWIPALVGKIRGPVPAAPAVLGFSCFSFAASVSISSRPVEVVRPSSNAGRSCDIRCRRGRALALGAVRGVPQDP